MSIVQHKYELQLTNAYSIQWCMVAERNIMPCWCCLRDGKLGLCLIMDGFWLMCRWNAESAIQFLYCPQSWQIRFDRLRGFFFLLCLHIRSVRISSCYILSCICRCWVPQGTDIAQIVAVARAHIWAPGQVLWIRAQLLACGPLLPMVWGRWCCWLGEGTSDQRDAGTIPQWWQNCFYQQKGRREFTPSVSKSHRNIQTTSRRHRAQLYWEDYCYWFSW